MFDDARVIAREQGLGIEVRHRIEPAHDLVETAKGDGKMQVNARMVLDGLDEVNVDMLDEAIDVEGAGLDVPHVRADGQRRKIGRVAKRERRERIDLARNDDIGAAAS